jgi:gliding motility-associated-like protein
VPEKIIKRLRILLAVIAVFLSFFAHSQLCTGSLGDPAVNITFGTGTTPDFNFTPPSAYTYVSNTCPNDGFYTIATSTSGCFGNAWHTVSSDHTGGGAFMLVNASNTPGDFFVATVTDLCPNTTYEFSAWIMNVLISPTGIQPDLTFKVETPSGTILNQFNTGGIAALPSPRWDKYGFFFTTTAGNPTIVLRITNNAPGGIGNDLALDDITFRPCGPAITSSIQGSGDEVDLCIYNQNSYTFDGFVSAGYSNPVYQWQASADSGRTWTDIAGANTLLFVRQPTVAGNYKYRLSVAEAGNVGLLACRVSSNILSINVHPKPVVNAGPDRILITGNAVTLAATVTGDSPVYNWSPPTDLSDATALNPLASPDADRQYTLFVESAYGCINEDAMNIKVVAGIFVPTAFTPNNDGKNDTWTIPFLDATLGATVTVFNRYGQLVYKVTGEAVNWDGKIDGIIQPSGSYVYMISFKKGIADMKGTVTIIR